MDQPMNAGVPETGKGNGPIVGIIVVIIVLAIGAYYLFAELQSQKMTRDAQESTEVQDIENDVTAEDAELDALQAELDADMQELDAELQAQ